MSLKKIILTVGFLLALIPSTFADDWEVRRHTEYYDDHMTQGYYIQKTIDNVKVSNGTSNSGLGTIVLKFSAPDLMIFTVYEEGLENPPKKFYKADYTYYTFSDDKGNSVNFAVDTTKGNGNTITGMKALAIRRMMINSPYVRGNISIENMSYDFLINSFEFRKKFISLCEKLDYTEEEIQRAIGHESAIFDSLFRKVCAQMTPYYTNGKTRKIYSDVNVRAIEEDVNDIKELFPDYADNIFFEFHKISYAEWLSFFSMKYNEDITKLKDMNKVQRMFELLTVEITPIDEMPMVSHSPLLTSLNKLDKLNGEELTPEYEKPLPLPENYKAKEEPKIIEEKKEVEEKPIVHIPPVEETKPVVVVAETKEEPKIEEPKVEEPKVQEPKAEPKKEIEPIKEEKKEEPKRGIKPKEEVEKAKAKEEKEKEERGLYYARIKQERANYIKLRSYGVGITTYLKKPIENKLSFGGILEANSFFNKNHGISYGAGYLFDGSYHSIEQFLGYSFRIPFNKKFEMQLSPSFVLSLKNIPCVAVNKVLYGDKITNNYIGFLGLRFDMGFNWFIKDKFFISFGVSDRILSKGFTLLDRYKEVTPTPPTNNAEGYIGIGISF